MKMTLMIDLDEIRELVIKAVLEKYGFSVTSDKINEIYEHPDYDTTEFTGFKIDLTNPKEQGRISVEI